MKHSEILRKAKTVLSKKVCSGPDSWVCYAIYQCAKTEADEKKANQITRKIREQLNQSFTILDWLQEKSYDVYIASPRQIQNYRLRWMDKMIQEYERVGK